MLLVKSIEVIEVNADICDLFHKQQPSDTALPQVGTVHITKEMVSGKQFTNAQGQTICIGMSKQVQDAIGLPFEVLDNLNKALFDDNEAILARDTKIQRQKDRINFYVNMSFWKKLKYLFSDYL